MYAPQANHLKSDQESGQSNPAVAIKFQALINWFFGTVWIIARRATGIINAPPIPLENPCKHKGLWEKWPSQSDWTEYKGKTRWAENSKRTKFHCRPSS